MAKGPRKAMPGKGYGMSKKGMPGRKPKAMPGKPKKKMNMMGGSFMNKSYGGNRM